MYTVHHIYKSYQSTITFTNRQGKDFVVVVSGGAKSGLEVITADTGVLSQ
jgi:ribosomal protein S11